METAHVAYFTIANFRSSRLCLIAFQEKLFGRINKIEYQKNFSMNIADLKYVSDEEGNQIAVIVPIEIWNKLISSDDTSYLLQSETMKKRLLSAKNRQTGISLDSNSHFKNF